MRSRNNGAASFTVRVLAAAALALLVASCSPACVKQSSIYPTYPAGSCSERSLEVYRYLSSTPPPMLPTIITLQSGERVYIPDTAGNLPIHYDGPECQ